MTNHNPLAYHESQTAAEAQAGMLAEKILELRGRVKKLKILLGVWMVLAIFSSLTLLGFLLLAK